MPPLTTDLIADLIQSTQKDLGRLKWEDLTGDIQEYHALPNILRKEKVEFESGEGIQFNLMTTTSGSFRWTGVAAQDQVAIKDVMTKGWIEWRFGTANYAIDRRELAMNRDNLATRVLELVKIRRTDAMISIAEGLEICLWGKPANSSDKITPYGIEYYIVKNSAEGFNGGLPAGFSTVANVNLTDVPRYKNWTNSYTNVSKTDLITKMRKAYVYTKFISPVAVPSYGGPDRHVLYMRYDTLAEIEQKCEEQNENLGNDIASKDGKVTFRGNRMTNVPYLDADTTYPVYFVNWAQFVPVFLKGEYMREEPPEKAPNQHTVLVTHVDLSLNFKCPNRRRLAVLSK